MTSIAKNLTGTEAYVPDMRIERTRAYLRNAYLELLDEKPYNKVTVRDVAERACLSRTAFYNHYASIDDLAVDCYVQKLGTANFAFPSLLEDKNESNLAEALLDNMAELMRFLVMHRSFARAVLGEIDRSPYYEEAIRVQTSYSASIIDSLQPTRTEIDKIIDRGQCAFFIATGLNSLIRRFVIDNGTNIEAITKEIVLLGVYNNHLFDNGSVPKEVLATIANWHPKFSN